MQQFLTFFVGGEEVAVNILQIREVIEYRAPTRVPVAPAYLRGVINLRGAVVPVVDLALKLGLPAVPLTRTSCLVVVEVPVDGKLTLVGVTAESVGQVIELSLRDIEPAPAFGASLRAGALLGLGRLAERFVPILDVDALLAERADLQAVLGAGAPGAGDAPRGELPEQAGGAAGEGAARAEGERAP